ncbi:MAG: hypothetical protein ACLVD2_13390 [Blautia sp.]
MKQKHLIRKSAAVFTAAALCISAAPVSVWAEDDYKTQAKDSLAGFAKDIAKKYESSMSAVDTNADSFGVKMNLGLSIDPSVAPMLSSLVGIDMSWLSKISLAMDQKLKNNILGVQYDIQLNDTEICPVNAYMDMITNDVYMNIPTISDGYIYGGDELLAGELEEDTDIDTGEDSLILPENFSMSEYMQTLPSAADIEDFLNHYGSILIDKADEVETVEESLYASGAEQNCTRYTGYYLPSTINNMGKDLAATAKEDTRLKEFLDHFSEIYSPEENLYDYLIQSLESSGGDEVPSDEEGFLTFSVWKDENGKTAGFETSVFGGTDPQTGEDSVVSFVYQNPKQDNNSGLIISFSDGTNYLDLQGSGTITDGKLDGMYTLHYNNDILFHVNVTGYDTEAAKSGSIIGKYSFKAAEGLAGANEELYSMLSAFTLDADLNIQAAEQKYSLSLVSSDTALATLDINMVSSSDMEIPDLSALENVYDASDETSMNGFAATLNLEPVLNNLLTAGMPEELLMALLYGDTAGEAYTEEPGAEVPAETEAPADTAAAA